MKNPPWRVLILVSMMWLAVWPRSAAIADADQSDNVFAQLDLLIEVRHELVENYVEQPDQRKLIESAVMGMVESVGDPYTTFLTPEELEPFDQQVHGSFSGIGAEITIDEQARRPRVITPIDDDTPAWKAGILPGDLILEIDGQSTEGFNIRQTVKQLTGPAGTKVRVKVRHESGEEQAVEITREIIKLPSLRALYRDQNNKWNYLLDPQQGIGYIRLGRFSDSTADELRQTLKQLLEQKPRGLILDMRFNPGGLLEAAVQVADLFLPSGQTIVSVRGRTVPEKTETATADATLTDIPMVVLANEASASAAEIVTGALTDNKRAKFIGMRTFGKGSVQQVRMLESGRGALKVTNAYYYLPSGRKIHRAEDSEIWGVDPEDGFFVPMTPQQIQEFVEVRRKGQVRQPTDAAGQPLAITPEFLETELKDPQLAAGLRAMAGRLQTGQWPEVGQSGADLIAREIRRKNLQSRRELLLSSLETVNQELQKLEKADGDPTSSAPSTAPAENHEPDETLVPQMIEP